VNSLRRPLILPGASLGVAIAKEIIERYAAR
jgi:hypothetical protein